MLSRISIVMVSVVLLNVMASHKWCWQSILSVLVNEQLLTNLLYEARYQKSDQRPYF